MAWVVVGGLLVLLLVVWLLGAVLVAVRYLLLLGLVVAVIVGISRLVRRPRS